MKVNKEIVKKVKRLNKLEEEAKAIRKELHEHFEPYMDGVVYFGEMYRIADEPCGEHQGEGEYCSQGTYGYSEDSGYGTYYYPTEGSKKYVAISYEF